jgi:hypothetical protein
MLYRRLLSRPVSLLSVLAGLAFAAPAPAADYVHVIVLTNGHQVEVKTMPEVKGNYAYFATLSGQQFYTRASNIDQQKTQERNAEREKASVIAAEIRTEEDTPSNSSLGALAENEKRRRAVMAPAKMVTARDLERSNKVELNSVERLQGAPVPDNKSEAPATETVTQTPPGTIATQTITVPITLAPQPAPAPDAGAAPATAPNSGNNQ